MKLESSKDAQDLTMMAGTKIFASTESAEVSEVLGTESDAGTQHEQTFHCLTS